jgi:O-antigen ligase
MSSPTAAPLDVSYSLAQPRPRFDAATALTVHIFLLLLVPSSLTIAGMAAYGRPSLIWGLLLLFWWVIWHLEGQSFTIESRSDPVRMAFFFFVVAVLLSFSDAMLRGQPSDQISPAISAVIRVASWGGVVLTAIDGLQYRDQVIKLVRRLTMIGGLLAVFGLVQAITGQTFLAWLAAVPGVQFNADDTISARGTFSRSAGLAVHPLEHVTVLIGILPLAIVCGVSRGFARGKSRVGVAWWLPTLVIALSCLVSVSRSAIVGLVVAFIASLPAMPRRQRWGSAGLAAIGVGVVAIAIPGMLSTITSLFLGASSDPSTQSRTNALSRVPDFMASSPWLGSGFGTFLPRYYIFDNQWVMLLVEVGIVGTLAFASTLFSAVWSSYRARLGADDQFRSLCSAMAASVIALGTAYSLFDALAFPMSAGLLFLALGLCGALLKISHRQSAS